MHYALLILLLAASPGPQTPKKPQTQTPCPEVAALSERVLELERENSQLKSRIIELLSAASANRTEPSADDRAVTDALAALRSLKTATQGSILDFRRYYLDAAAKVDAIPPANPRRAALQQVVAVYSDAHELLTLGAKGRASVLDEQRWSEIRSRYQTQDISPGCSGVRIFGQESADSRTLTRCGITLCSLAEGRLQGLLHAAPAPPVSSKPAPASPQPSLAPTPEEKAALQASQEREAAEAKGRADLEKLKADLDKLTIQPLEK